MKKKTLKAVIRVVDSLQNIWLPEVSVLKAVRQSVLIDKGLDDGKPLAFYRKLLKKVALVLTNFDKDLGLQTYCIVGLRTEHEQNVTFWTPCRLLE